MKIKYKESTKRHTVTGDWTRLRTLKEKYMTWPGSGGYERAMKISSLSLVGIKNIFVKCKALRIEYTDVFQPQPQKAWK